MEALQKILCVLIFLGFCSSVQANSELEKLPFGIVIGKTTNKEVEARGICLKQIKIKENHFRCERYNMANRFIIKSSQNEIVTSLVFGGNSDYRNPLPRNWKKLGLKLHSFQDTYSQGQDNALYQGTMRPKFIEIIKKQGANDIQIKESKKYNFVTHVTFYIGGYFYDAEFWEDNPKGFSKLSVFEGY